jgi:lysophospholipase L1-like esterase
VLLIGLHLVIRLLALGDSYTIGESVEESERWPVQLGARLQEQGITTAPPQIIARTGWTTDELAAAIEETLPRGPYDLVTLQIGVNNQYRGRDAEEYRLEFRALLEEAVKFAGSRPDRVIVLSIPDWGVTPYAEGRDRSGIAQEIDRFNAINRDETVRAGARYVDITPESRRAALEPVLVAGDGLHPSGEMYRLWAALVLPHATSALLSGRRSDHRR